MGLPDVRRKASFIRPTRKPSYDDCCWFVSVECSVRDNRDASPVEGRFISQDVVIVLGESVGFVSNVLKQSQRE